MRGDDRTPGAATPMARAAHLISCGRVAMAAVVIAVSACAASTATTAGAPTPVPGGGTSTVMAAQPWQSATREHIDLWLHGYALLTRDSAHVPLFARGYASRMAALKTQRNVFTQLDANRERLTSQLAANPALVNGQFVPLYFSSWNDLRGEIDRFVQVDGNVNATSDMTERQYFAVLAASFPTPAMRDWLRLFAQSLDDEDKRFYHDYWTQAQRDHAATQAAFDSLWQKSWRPKLQRFLNNTQQANGELILSLPLDGEGRTISLGKTGNTIAVEFPDDPASAVNAVYVFAHEAVNAITTTAISDNITPTQQRAGVGADYAANAAVRGGAMLLQKAAPQLAAGYMRHYLASTGATPPAGDPTPAFTAAFPLPQVILDAIGRQIDVVLGGI